VGEAFNRLDTNAQKVMQALAVYNRPVTPAAVDYLLAPHLPAIDSAPILQRLANMHFARKESGRFYLHPVDREFAFGLIGTSDQGLGIRNQENDAPESLVTNRLIPNHLFTQHDLLTRAADYFAQARKPRAEWKKLEDLSAQLAEFDLRCAAGDYDSAASVLRDFDADYLLLWGHYLLTIDLHNQIQGKIKDSYLTMTTVWLLGLAYNNMGQTKKAIGFYTQTMELARKINDKQAEGATLNNLGSAYSALGEISKSIEFQEQALVIAREIGDNKGEGARLANLAEDHLILGDYDKSIEYYNQALQNARKIGNKYGEGKRLNGLAKVSIGKDDLQGAISNSQESLRIGHELISPEVCSESSSSLTLAHLFQNDLVNARTTIEAALQYDEPGNNHNVTALHGIIALRHGDEVTARGAFVRAIGQADEILSKTAEYYSALDAKGLAMCGLLICDLRLGKGDPSMPTETNDGKPVPPENVTFSDGRGAPTVDDAIETFRKARKIAPHAGVVKATLRLFDELMKCKGGEILKDVRKAVEGK